MNWLNSWASGIVVSVIVATLIEMLLPESKNKKYIKTIIGIFVLFSIVAPVITKITNTNIDFETILANNSEFENYFTNTKQIDTNKTILDTYELNLKKEIQTKIEEKGYQVLGINLNIDNTEENFGMIKKIELNVLQNKENNKIETINKIEININKNEEKIEAIPNDVSNELKEYISDIYKIDKENIIIN